jgi:uncharacterized protein YdiU (UPF0061 family)
MSVAARPVLAFRSTFREELPELCEPWQAERAPAPELLVLNEDLAAELGADPAELRSAHGIGVLTGAEVLPGSEPVAQAYAGHQFGVFVPRLGDGRALLLGEVADAGGGVRDVHLKGSGRTPFARGGDGKAAVGPMLREYVVGEAMHALGIPTSRALAVVATGERVFRETALPGAVLARVAASHLRVGTFQYVAARGDRDLVRRLADYAIDRHHPEAAEQANPYLALLAAVVEAQAGLVARWMLAGFVHGVMNTDNMTISGESIDYGPCAFIDAFDPAAVFSSIDHGGRYAFGNQPHVAPWNLARLAESLLPLIDHDQQRAVDAASEVVQTFPARFHDHWSRGMHAKLGLRSEPADGTLVNDLLALMQRERADYTSFLRALSGAARGDASEVRAHVLDRDALDAWLARWRAEGPPDAGLMDRVNPVYIPRNHLVEDALAHATAGDLGPLHRLLDAVTRPFEPRPGLEAYAEPAPEEFAAGFRTFCGT